MVAQGGQGPWQPRRSGLLVEVLAVLVVVLVVYGAIMLVLLKGGGPLAAALPGYGP